jgi:hypothetical protein
VADSMNRAVADFAAYRTAVHDLDTDQNLDLP